MNLQEVSDAEFYEELKRRLSTVQPIMLPSNINMPVVVLGEALSQVKATKPNDRSELDRHYQILITDLEKLLAYALVWLENE